MKPRLHAINIPIYNDCLRVFFGSRDDAISAIKKEGQIPDYIAEAFRDSIDEGAANGVYLYNTATKYHLVWMPVLPYKVWHYTTLVHELQHFVFKFLDLRGFSHTEASDEAYSYLLGYIYGEIDSIIVDLREKEDKQNKPEMPL